mmetsp:Transcript_92962/g.199371  ORF Transcript_92962/g.199371 Transcript_92962/m.199371 type:complete len:254 (-) Transcript_92962:33-794(-)
MVVASSDIKDTPAVVVGSQPQQVEQRPFSAWSLSVLTALSSWPWSSGGAFAPAEAPPTMAMAPAGPQCLRSDESPCRRSAVASSSTASAASRSPRRTSAARESSEAEAATAVVGRQSLQLPGRIAERRAVATCPLDVDVSPPPAPRASRRRRFSRYDSSSSLSSSGGSRNPSPRPYPPSPSAELDRKTVVAPFQPQLEGSANEDHDECAICLNAFVAGDLVRTLPCSHRYCCICIDQWLADSRSCPLCKQVVM